MKKTFYYSIILFTLLTFGTLSSIYAQNPPCVIDTNHTSPGVYPDSLPPATGCTNYSVDITFLLPRDTTVSGVLVNFETFTINSITGLPPGMNWVCNNSANGCVYDVSPGNPNPEVWGCVNISGSPFVLNSTVTYNLTITVTATTDNILSPTNVVTFNKNLVVFPCQLGCNYLSYNQSSTCEPSNVTFSTTLPSNGNPNYHYSWNFNNGNNSNLETPPVQSYNSGDFPVSLTITIDTFDYYVDSISIDLINCTDPVGAPDLYWGVFQGGNTIVPFTTPGSGGPSVPVNTGINFTFTPGQTFSMEVWDDDSPTSSDDGCATNTGGSGADVSFTPSATPGVYFAQNNGLKIAYRVAHPVVVLNCQDTIHVEALPQTPSILVLVGDTTFCPGENVILGALTQNGIQWHRNGAPIPNATGATYTATTTGAYTVQAISGANCTSMSAPVNVTVNPNPTFSVSSNTGAASATYTVSNVQPTGTTYYQWFTLQNGVWVQDPLAFQATYTITHYACVKVKVMNAVSECFSEHNFGCFIPTGIDNEQLITVNVYPNPTEDEINVSMNLALTQNVKIQVKDMLGREVLSRELPQQSGEVNEKFSLSTLPKGVYLIEVASEKASITQKVILK
jgi:hypothetical protein